jgi:hypothetical protein
MPDHALIPCSGSGIPHIACCIDMHPGRISACDLPERGTPRSQVVGELVNTRSDAETLFSINLNKTPLDARGRILRCITIPISSGFDGGVATSEMYETGDEISRHSSRGCCETG